MHVSISLSPSLAPFSIYPVHRAGEQACQNVKQLMVLLCSNLPMAFHFLKGEARHSTMGSQASLKHLLSLSPAFTCSQPHWSLLSPMHSPNSDSAFRLLLCFPALFFFIALQTFFFYLLFELSAHQKKSSRKLSCSHYSMSSP